MNKDTIIGKQLLDISRKFDVNLFSFSNPHPEVLKELTDSRHSVYDVLPTFFNHDDPWIALGMISFVYSFNLVLIIDIYIL